MRKKKELRERRVVVYLSESDFEALEGLQEKTGAPFSEMLRRAIASWLKEQK
jgi:hypothetical protein